MRDAIGSSLLLIALAAAPPAPGQEPPGVEVVPLRLTVKEYARDRLAAAGAPSADWPPPCPWGRMVERDRPLRFPFPNRIGELLLQVVGGRVFADRNGDGRIDGEDEPALESGTTYQVSARIGGRELPYPVQSGVQLGEVTFISLSSRAVLEGRWRGWRLLISDNDMNGRFGSGEKGRCGIKRQGYPETAPGYPFGSHCQYEDWILAEKEGEPDQSFCRPFSRILALAGRWYELEISEERLELTIRPWPGKPARLAIETGKGTRFERAVLATDDGLCTYLMAGQPRIDIPPGAYQVLEWCLSIPGQSAASAPTKVEPGGFAPDAPRFYKLGWGRRLPVTVREGENRLLLGPPFSLEFRAIAAGPGPARLEITEGNLVGIGGESYALCSELAALTYPQAFLRLGGEKVFLGRLNYG